ncbi:ATP-dependent DNA helicase RecG, partial [Patescibacteria group bacterium]|nr:ATP-dependent DNA helicase RecG [Patescibacteria group bacterium]
MTLSTPLSEVPRVGPVYEKRLKKLGITTVGDLLFHFPRAYEDLRNVTSIAQAKKEEGNVCVKGRVLKIRKGRTLRKHMSLVQAAVEDDTGTMQVVWFNQPYLTDTLKEGEEVYLAGKMARGSASAYLSNPAYEKAKALPMHTGRIVPVYAQTLGLTSRWLRFMVSGILQNAQGLSESLPPTLLQERGFPPIVKALQDIHFPNTPKEAEASRRRFAFEELFYLFLFVLSERKKLAAAKAPVIPFEPSLLQRFTSSLPFQLTEAQRKAAWRILKDLEKPRPMNRLLQGDVGSGKTVVAAMAALSARKAGLQTAFMAPTEILAQQHFKTLSLLFAPFKLKVALLTGKSDRWTSPKLPREPIEISRKKLLEKVKAGDMEVLVGTHALIQDKVRFGNLGLIVLDEQHRFGVRQRAKLQAASRKGHTLLVPHLLSMTATPIPRTLTLTLYGDLDLTLLDELPQGRKPVLTQVIAPEERKLAYKAVRKEIQKGRQVFVICPRIEEKSEIRNTKYEINSKFLPSLEVKSVKAEYERLSKEVFPDLRVAMLHGKLAQKEKEAVMRKFQRGTIDILVSTSVVEVGVDVPNATVMLIEGAEHFGLAQLHQFRGRVGRSAYQSHCFLFTESSSSRAASRLKALEESSSGFELAEKDLKLRGPGDLAGVKQWGMPDFAMEQLTNLPLVEEAREAALQILDEDIRLEHYPLLKEKVEKLRER